LHDEVFADNLCKMSRVRLVFRRNHVKNVRQTHQADTRKQATYGDNYEYSEDTNDDNVDEFYVEI